MLTSAFCHLLLLGYVGPGAGLTAFGALLAVVAAIVLTFVGFVWYPLRRFLRRLKSNAAGVSETKDGSSS